MEHTRISSGGLSETAKYTASLLKAIENPNLPFPPGLGSTCWHHAGMNQLPDTRRVCIRCD